MNPRQLTRNPLALSLGITSPAAVAAALQRHRHVPEAEIETCPIHPDQDNISEKAREIFAEGGWNAWDPSNWVVRPYEAKWTLFRSGDKVPARNVGTFGLFSLNSYQVIAWK